MKAVERLQCICGRLKSPSIMQVSRPPIILANSFNISSAYSFVNHGGRYTVTITHECDVGPIVAATMLYPSHLKTSVMVAIRRGTSFLLMSIKTPPHSE